MSQAKSKYDKERDDAATAVIEESMMRKIGRSFPQGYKAVNPVQSGHTDNGYKPHKW